MLIGFDADQDCAPVAQLAAAKGVRFVCRYLKNLSTDEVRALLAAGLAVVLIFESTAERALAGLVAGAADGAKAASQTLALAAPAGTAIYATADFDCTADQQPAALTYFAAFKKALAGAYKLGVYANGAVCVAAAERGIADYTWVAGGRGMRGTKNFIALGKPTIVQDVGDARGLSLGIGIDSDTAMADDFGGWSATPAQAAAPASPAPQPVAIPAARDMQAALNAAGAALDVDGIWGPMSAAALAAYYDNAA